MTFQEIKRLKAERNELATLLAQAPAHKVIDRLSLENRKSEVEKTLAAHPAAEREPVRAKLTFRGKPVVGSHGIFAEFGAKAVQQFTDAVTKIAVGMSGPLGERGVVPNRDEHQLMITGTALGSFGFELEEITQDDANLFPESSNLGAAIEKAKSLMEASLGSDDDLSDVVSDVEPRALTALHDFLQTIAEKEAVCSLEFKDKRFRFKDLGEVQQSKNRLSRDNIREEDDKIVGAFQGVLPKRRTFEFKRADTGEIITGKVGPAIEDAGQINLTLGKKTQIFVHATRVGAGRSRFVLQKYDEPRE